MTALEQIKDFIENTKEPFSAQLVAQKLDLNIVLARYYLPKLFAEKYIQLVKIDNHTKFYASIENQEKTFVSTFDRIKSFVEQANKPFTNKEIVQELGIKYQTVQKNLNMLALKGYVIQIDIGVDQSTKIYISKLTTDKVSIPSIETNYQKIKNYVENTSEEFSSKSIATELDLTVPVACKYLSILNAEGHIKMIRFYKSTNIFVSKMYKGGCWSDDTSIISSYDMIKNFINNSNGPFTVNQIEKTLYLTYSNVMLYIPRLLKQGDIKMLGRVHKKKFYISNSYQGKIPIITRHDKLKNYISHLNHPFTANNINNEFGLTDITLQRHISKLLADGYIKLIGMDNHAKVYISNNYQGDIPVLSSYGKVKNYIHSSNKPFTVKLIADETGLHTGMVGHHITNLHAEGYIKLIGKLEKANVYILKSNQEKLPEIMNNYNRVKNIATHKIAPFTIKGLAIEVGLSSSTVNGYLQMMVVESNIKEIGKVSSKRMYISNNYQGDITDIMSNQDKIKNYVFQASFPFTTKMISGELNISCVVVIEYIRTLREDGYIKQIYVENGCKVYVSNTYQGLIPPSKDTYYKIKSYIYYLGMPFTVKKVISELGIVYDNVKHNISKLIKEGYIKYIGIDKRSKVYILNRLYGKE